MSQLTSHRMRVIERSLSWIIALVVATMGLLPLSPALSARAAAPLRDLPTSQTSATAADDPVCVYTATERPNPNAAITSQRRQPGDFILPTQSVTVTVDPLFNRKEITLISGQFTLPQIQQAITALDAGNASLLENTGKVWLLGGDLIIRREAALRVINDTATELRLTSTAAVSSTSITNNGYLLLESTKVVGWDSTNNAPDADFSNGRAYVLTDRGGRTDVLGSEIAYLGYEDGKASGLAWRRCFDPAVPATGSTGDIHDSDIHHNFFGMYSFQANGIWAKNNKVHDNLYYGLDPHDFSHHFIFEGNEVYKNGKHGIIFSRSCDYNIIRANNVHDNAPTSATTTTIAHGIFLDRRSNFNLVINNTSQNNQDGIVVFQSTDNLIQGNTIQNNGASGGGAGIRINATPVPPNPDGTPDRTPDQPAVHNLVIGNTVENNATYGIYLYARADSNTIQGNTIEGNGRHDTDGLAPGAGIQITAGGNTVGPGNVIRNNGHGIGIADQTGSQATSNDDSTEQTPSDIALAAALAPTAIDPGLPPGSGNTLTGNTITGNKSRGIRLVGLNNGANQNIVQGNEIANNGDEGIYLDTGNNNQFVANFVHHNGIPTNQVDEDNVPDLGNYGISIKVSNPGKTSNGNLLHINRITANGRNAIKLGIGVNGNIQPPRLLQVQPTFISGDQAIPGAKIEVFRDPKTGCGKPLCNEAAEVFGTTTANQDGTWRVNGNTVGAFNYSANQTDAQHNSSQLFAAKGAPNIFVAPGRLRGQNNPTPRPQTIFVEGSDTVITLKDLQTILASQNHASLLTDNGIVDGKRTWTLRANLNISPTVTLNIVGGAGTPSDRRVDWLRLRSDPGPLVPTPNPGDPEHPFYDTTKFATLTTYSGHILLQNVKVTAWDTVNNKTDAELRDGRAYVLAKYDADLTIANSELSYLGYADGEAYGVAWRDVNPTKNADGTAYNPAIQGYRTRVTGSAINSIFSHNYYGVYTFQARDMMFRGDKFISNIQYGFDPHDFTHDVLVENSEAFDNGSHGFIISRGCNNFIFRNNITHQNQIKPGSKNPSAHGFMLDPGAPTADEPQAPSTNNLYENNEAYGNTGYGFRVYGSNNNVIRGNRFHDNWSGITLEYGSTGNIIAGNAIANSTGQPATDGSGQVKGGNGVYAFQGADGNTIVGNTITGHLSNGVYLKTANNVVQQNTVSGNQVYGIGTAADTSDDQPDPPPPEIQLSAERAALIPGLYIDDQEPISWSLANATTPTNNTIISNTIQTNLGGGIALKNAAGAQVIGNTVAQNSKDGIYIASASVGNLVQSNAVKGNQGYGIKVNGADVRGNTLMRNTVLQNSGGGIAVTGGANGGITPPKISQGSTGEITGTSLPNATIEIYSDTNRPAQAAFYEGTIVADASGAFVFKPTHQRGAYFTATARDNNGNTSGLSKPTPANGQDYGVFIPIVVR